jgi:hypothetical protein
MIHIVGTACRINEKTSESGKGHGGGCARYSRVGAAEPSMLPCEMRVVKGQLDVMASASGVYEMEGIRVCARNNDRQSRLHILWFPVYVL